MSKRKMAFLKEENLLTLLSQNNFIVPEIQREYVWGNNENVIIGFLQELKNKIGDGCSECHLPSSVNKINIGFLYSYKPDYVKIKHERFLDENLIDGQQRFTTLFLLLFYCALKENRKDEFLTLIRFEEKIGMSFDYKVRDLTRRFLLEFVEKINSIDELVDIDQQTWVLKDYKQDFSIQSILKAIGYIQSEFLNGTRYYNHLLNNIVFWHFKTEVTSQGEELYITMNARGEELADNEITKAALMLGGKELVDSGKKWEVWQHFFWKNRNKNISNSDQGFNGFLRCIAGLEYYINEREEKASEKNIQKLLSIAIVEKYINTFKYLMLNMDICEESYDYCDWTSKLLSEIWDIINKNETDWFADYKDKNKSTEQNRMILIWSIFYYISKYQTTDTKPDIEYFRVLRFFYVRYKNNNRSVATLKKTIDAIKTNGIFNNPDGDMGNEDSNPQEETDKKFRTSEEELKYSFLQGSNQETESIIWEIEDHPLNINGTDVGAINISHLIDFDSNPSIENLRKIKKCFNEDIFPDGSTKGSNTLTSILLFYGKFWKDNSTGYYKRYNFSEWRKHIRNPLFKEFFYNFLNYDGSLKGYYEDLSKYFLHSKKDMILNSKNTLPLKDLSLQFCFYAVLLQPEVLWKEGEYISIRYDTDSERLFEDEKLKIYNSKGSFKGNKGNTDLWEKVLEEYQDPIEYLKLEVKK